MARQGSGPVLCSPARLAALPPAGVAGAPTSELIAPPTSPRGGTMSGIAPVEVVMVGETKGEGWYGMGVNAETGGDENVGAGGGGRWRGWWWSGW